MNLLEVDSLHVSYGKMEVIHGVSFSIGAGEIIGIIGNNGGGKSTILNTIARLVKARSGKIIFNGQEISDIPPHEVVAMGISLVPGSRRLFPYLSVDQNLTMGAYNQSAWYKRETNRKNVYEIYPALLKAKDRQARSLSGGQQQMLAMARGLMSEPKLLMLDEISEGLAPYLVSELFKIIGHMRERGVTVLVAEQHVVRVLNAASRAYVVENGQVVMEGSGKELLNSSEIKKAYLRV